jgi:hypothetical protein
LSTDGRISFSKLYSLFKRQFCTVFLLVLRPGLAFARGKLLPYVGMEITDNGAAVIVSSLQSLYGVDKRK